MITYTSGDIFQSPARVLVNTVNTVGVMGKGIALKFKRIYPDMFDAYRNFCEQGDLQIGKLYLYKTPNKWILNFPTKKHWRNPSKEEYIKAGLWKVREHCTSMGMSSIAFPELGCGNGGLDFETQVKPLMEEYLGSLSIPIFIYIRSVKPHPPEHKDIRNIKRWLRSEPSALPFDEVWQDVLDVLREQCQFRTMSQQNPYSVEATVNPPTLLVASCSRTKRIHREELVEFWQQLRDFGLTYRGIAPEPGLVSYLLPIFSKLPYVEPIRVSRSSRGLRWNPAAGVQVIPPPMTMESAASNLFATSDHAAEG